MDAATLKPLALAEIIEKLMKKNPPPHPWSAEVRHLETTEDGTGVEDGDCVGVDIGLLCLGIAENSLGGFVREDVTAGRDMVRLLAIYPCDTSSYDSGHRANILMTPGS